MVSPACNLIGMSPPSADLPVGAESDRGAKPAERIPTATLKFSTPVLARTRNYRQHCPHQLRNATEVRASEKPLEGLGMPTIGPEDAGSAKQDDRVVARRENGDEPTRQERKRP
jgi:hypothetical protein